MTLSHQSMVELAEISRGANIMRQEIAVKLREETLNYINSFAKKYQLSDVSEAIEYIFKNAEKEEKLKKWKASSKFAAQDEDYKREAMDFADVGVGDGIK